MELTRITYGGGKVYRDKLSGNSWAPGDSKLVSAEHARKLLRFPEFTMAGETAAQPTEQPPVSTTTEPTVQELEAALLAQNIAKRKEQDEHAQKEAVLLTVESMDKDALKEYAAKYEVKLNGQKGVATLRAEVSTLIEQFGAR